MITDNPESSEDRISELVGEAWDDLSLSEKTTYELKAGIQSLQKGWVGFVMHAFKYKS